MKNLKETILKWIIKLIAKNNRKLLFDEVRLHAIECVGQTVISRRAYLEDTIPFGLMKCNAREEATQRLFRELRNKIAFEQFEDPQYRDIIIRAKLNLFIGQ